MGEFNEVDAIRKEFIDKYGEPKERILDDEDIAHFQKLHEEEIAAEEKEMQGYIDDLNNFKDEFGESNAFLESLIKKYDNETGTGKGTEIKDANDFSMYLLAEANVATVTGDAFGNPNCIRFSYATSDDILKEALRRIKEAVS
jgi:hypothetical protein